MGDEPIAIVEADLADPDHARAVVELTAAYASDAMGNGAPLPEAVLRRLIAGLAAHPTTMVLLASVGRRFVGIATCFGGFSTFAARPIINVHDLYVIESARGRGIGRGLLTAVEAIARQRDCAKITLEVQEMNHRARHLYEAVGFSQAVYRAENGGALFYAKRLTPVNGGSGDD